MEQWIPFEEGEYLVKEAFLVAPDGAAIAIEKAIIEVWSDPKGQRRIKGTGMIRPFLMVELHEEHDEVDLIMDLGRRFKYRLKKPVLQAGKVFSPGVSTMLQFYPSAPWELIPEADFHALSDQIEFIEG